MGKSGFDRFPAYLRSGLLAPARTPETLIDKLNNAINEGLRAPEMQASIAKLGFETRGLTAREFGAKLDEEARSWEAAVERVRREARLAGFGKGIERGRIAANAWRSSCRDLAGAFRLLARESTFSKKIDVGRIPG